MSINVWTGAPLFAVWVGSRVQGSSSSPSMGAVFAVLAVLVALVMALVWLLARLNHAWDELTGRPQAHRRQSPWLRSMRGEREDVEFHRQNLGAFERLLAGSVALAIISFEVWFFFFSGSSIGHG